MTTKDRVNKESQTSSLKKVKVRRLTPLECERLQGFPDNYTKSIADGPRWKALGNAVTVPVIEFIIKNLVKSK